MNFKKTTYKLILVFLSIILLISIIVSVSLGSVKLNILDIWKIIINKSLNTSLFSPEWKHSWESIIWTIRLPRVLLAGIIGAGLSLTGILMQVLTKNPLAEPYILGVSSGASTGAVVSIMFDLYVYLGKNAISISAFLGALLSTFLVFKIACSRGQFSSTRLILTGIAISSMFSSITSYMIFSTKNINNMRSALFWLSGSLSNAEWVNIPLPLITVIFTFIISIILSPSFDALLVGEKTAITLGVNIKFTRIILIVLSTLLTGFIVSVSGIIGFIGLIIPHIGRTIVGSKHRHLIPFSLLSGSILLILADNCARLLVSPQELPIGVVTAFLGSPFFLWLLRKSSYSFGGKND